MVLTRRGARLFAVAFFAAAAALPGTARAGERKRRLLIIGIDGATWSVTNREAALGKMPAFAKLLAEGSRGTLKSFDNQPLASPVIWTTVATGVVPLQHGILTFERQQPGGRTLYTNSERRQPALWGIVSHYGGRANVVGWWPTWPASIINGAMISDRSFDYPVENGQYPAGAEKFVRHAAETVTREKVRLDFASFLGPEIPADAVSPKRLQELKDLEESISGFYYNDRVRLEQALELMAAEPADLTMVYFRGVDIASHFAWGFMTDEGYEHRAPPAPAERARLGPLVPRYYDFIDDAVAQLIAAAGDDCAVIVLSDHGFQAMEPSPTLEMEGLLRRFAWLVTDEAGKPDAERTVIAAIEPDWPVQATGRKFLFAPRASAAAKKDVVDALANAKDSQGTPVFGVKPISGGSGVFVELGPWVAKLREPRDGGKFGGHFSMRGEQYEIDEVVRLDGSHSGTHRLHGIVLVKGPGVRPGMELNYPTVYDVAPTALRLLGLPIARDFPGRVWTEALDDSKLEPARPSVKSFRGLVKIRRLGPTPEPPREEELRNDLFKLGYLH